MINYHTYHNSQLSILNAQLNKLDFNSLALTFILYVIPDSIANFTV